jgi:hypothetical protein
MHRHLSRLTRLSLASAIGLGTIAFAVPAFAEDATPLPVAEPIVASQNGPEAVAEGAISKLTVDPATRLADIQAKGAAAIAKRQTTLSELTAKLAAQTTDCGSNGAMTAEVAATSAGLATVGANLQTVTDLTAAKTLYRSIFTDYRVYLLVSPKAGKVIRCDAQIARNAALTADAAKLQAAIDEAKAKGVDTTAAQAAKDAAVAQLAGIVPANALNGVMGLVPDKGDKAVQAANTAALNASDKILDANFASQKSVHQQLISARKLLSGTAQAARAVAKTERAAAKAARVAARSTKKH